MIDMGVRKNLVHLKNPKEPVMARRCYKFGVESVGKNQIGMVVESY